MRRSLVVVVAALAGLALSSCGGDDKPSVSPTQQASDSGAKSAAAAGQTVRDYIDAFFGGDTERACALMTKAYQDENIKDGKDFGIEPDASCADAMKVGVQYATSLKLTASDFKVDQATVTGNEARVPVDAGKDLTDSTYTLTWSGSGWLVASDGT